jgi:hypothetical protein
VRPSFPKIAHHDRPARRAARIAASRRTSLNILLVAVVAVAAVSIGPAYYAVAQSSVVQDIVGDAPAAGRGLEVAQSGPVDAVTGVAQEASGLLGRYLGGQATLTLTGAYRPPLGGVGAALDRALLHRAAAATVRSLLSQVADSMVAGPAVAGLASPEEAGELPPARWYAEPEAST